MPVDARSAELAKLFCNMYRYIDFAVVNEFMMIAAQHGREVYPIIDAVNRGYKRGGIKSPGLTGGPCLYKDGFFLTGKIPYNELIASAWKIHETTPAYLVEQARALQAQIDGAKAPILGLAVQEEHRRHPQLAGVQAEEDPARRGRRRAPARSASRLPSRATRRCATPISSSSR